MGTIKSANSQSTQRNQKGESSRDPVSSLLKNCWVRLEWSEFERMGMQLALPQKEFCYLWKKRFLVLVG